MPHKCYAYMYIVCLVFSLSLRDNNVRYGVLAVPKKILISGQQQVEI